MYLNISRAFSYVTLNQCVGERVVSVCFARVTSMFSRYWILQRHLYVSDRNAGGGGACWQWEKEAKGRNVEGLLFMRPFNAKVLKYRSHRLVLLRLMVGRS